MRETKRITRRMVRAGILALAAVGAFSAARVQAQPITFQFSGFATGDLNGAPFASTEFLVTIGADISNLDLSLGADRPRYVNLTGTVLLNGIGVATFSDPLYVFDNQPGSTLGFGNPVNFDLIDLTDPAFATYGLTTPIGPVTNFLVYQNAQFTDVATSLGPLTFGSVLDPTVQALTSTPAVVPEPATVTLLAGGLGVVGMIGVRRRTRRA